MGVAGGADVAHGHSGTGIARTGYRQLEKRVLRHTANVGQPPRPVQLPLEVFCHVQLVYPPPRLCHILPDPVVGPSLGPRVRPRDTHGVEGVI